MFCLPFSSLRVSICSRQLKKLQTRGLIFPKEGAAAAFLYPSCCENTGFLLDCSVFSWSEHTVCGCGPLRPAWAAVWFPVWVSYQCITVFLFLKWVCSTFSVRTVKPSFFYSFECCNVKVNRMIEEALSNEVEILFEISFSNNKIAGYFVLLLLIISHFYW